MGRILIVDDESSVRETIGTILRYEKYDVLLAEGGARALRLLASEPGIEVVLLDVMMPGQNGIELLEAIKRSYPFMVAIMVSGQATLDLAVEATKKGAFDFLDKPVDQDRLLLTLRNAVRHLELTREKRSLELEIGKRFELHGTSACFLPILETIDRVAPTHARVLISGENGTGKELVARRIHALSPRRSGPFVDVNCAAIPRELIESELFGHEKGAFTGADSAKKGKFELADGGTLFLDEVGDMDLAAQAKVLRVLQENVVQRVGGAKPITIDVRVLAATNKDLEHEVKEGTFREDLYYRLNVVPLQVPPLRERREDIPMFVDLFSRRCSQENGLPRKAIAEEAIEILRKGDWPGNVRELKNAVERLVILSPGESIAPEDVRRLLRGSSGGEHDLFERCESFEEFKEKSEMLFFRRKLEENGGNVKRTAERLGMQRSNLYKKIERYGLR
jgi:two-component system nitrogen regulation response regulator NtrX